MHIVNFMTKYTTLIILFLVASLPATAQTSLGLLLGGSQTLDGGNIDTDFSNSLKEIFVATELEPGTVLRIRGGQVDSEDGPQVGLPGVSRVGNFEFIDALIEYRFYETFGSSSFFAGPGVYRQRFGTFDETDFGLSGGVNGIFPVSRRLALTGEVSYHWANFEESREFVTLAGGVRFSF